ncbi:5347_t:CDS:2 [Cetraspora pellucida]|uniref:5347_t:CDS:1 n=1 Tax=Cetraspora pellucida TaxID=1433469 RepID=A0A9N8YYB3_9GLOM|nr:5347_t:CDS:2 [Cetraspora pellucida]
MGCISSKSTESNDSQNTQSNSEFRYVDGRRFHNVENSAYPLPNDDDELDRLHSQHFFVRYLFQSNFSAPIGHLLSNPETKILDIGKLTYVHNKITTTEFVIRNVLEGLPFGDDSFDFVFQRFLFIGYPKEKWPFVINEIVRVLKPGGFLELCEPSQMYNIGPATKRLVDGEMEIFEQRNLDCRIHLKLEDYLKNQGQLENIKKVAKEIHHGIKSNNINLSKVAINNFVTAYTSFKSNLLKTLQISEDEFNELAKVSEKELFDFDSYFHFIRFYASKVVNNNKN